MTSEPRRGEAPSAAFRRWAAAFLASGSLTGVIATRLLGVLPPVAVGLLAVAGLSLAAGIAAQLRARRTRALADAASVAALVGLVLAGLGLGSALSTLAGARPELGAALLGLGLLGTGVLGLAVAPGLAWRWATRRSSAERPGLGVPLVLAGLATARLWQSHASARGAERLSTEEVALVRRRLDDGHLLDGLPAPARGVARSLWTSAPTACPGPPELRPTAFVTHLARELASSPVEVACVQADDAEALAQAVRARLVTRASRGPVRVELVVRTAELPTRSPAVSALFDPERSGLCSEVACLLPWQLAGLDAFERATFAGVALDLARPTAELVRLLEPHRSGSMDTRLVRVEVRSLDIANDVDSRAGSNPPAPPRRARATPPP